MFPCLSRHTTSQRPLTLALATTPGRFTTCGPNESAAPIPCVLSIISLLVDRGANAADRPHVSAYAMNRAHRCNRPDNREIGTRYRREIRPEQHSSTQQRKRRTNHRERAAGVNRLRDAPTPVNHRKEYRLNLCRSREAHFVR